MKTVEEYVSFLMTEPKLSRLPYNLKLQLKMVLQNHFEDESGKWIRRQLDRIHQYLGESELLIGLLKTLQADWRGRANCN